MKIRPLLIAGCIAALLVSLKPGQPKAQASTIGVVNADSIMRVWPRAQLAIKEVDSLAQTLEAQFQKELAAYRDKEAALRKGQDTEQANEELQNMAKALEQLQQDSKAKLQEDSQARLEPLWQTLQTTIKQVAQEQGYTHVLNRSQNPAILLYAMEGTNVGPAVMERLKNEK